MKRNQQNLRRPAFAVARLSFLIALTLWLGGLPRLLAQSVPDRLNYQGILLKGDGTPVPAVPTPVEFRIWDQAEGGSLKWSRIHTVTPDTNGLFSVVLMDGGAGITGETPECTSLAPVFATGTDMRYLELTVQGSTAIKPRQRLVAAAYSFLAVSAINVSGSGTLTLNNLAGNSVDSSKIVDGTIVNADISPSAAIADTKLATIATAGKVVDSALSANVALRSGGNSFSGSQTVSVPTGATAFGINGTGTGAQSWAFYPAASTNLVLLRPGLRLAMYANDGSAYFGGVGGDNGEGAPFKVKGGAGGGGNVVQVLGNIQLGPTGQYQAVAAAAEEPVPLRIVRGNVYLNGTTPYVAHGAGFSVQRNGVGDYTITFTTAFSDVPTFTANAIWDASTDAITTLSQSPSYVRLHIGVRSVGWVDVAFSFIAIGPR